MQVDSQVSTCICILFLFLRTIFRLLLTGEGKAVTRDIDSPQTRKSTLHTIALYQCSFQRHNVCSRVKIKKQANKCPKTACSKCLRISTQIA